MTKLIVVIVIPDNLECHYHELCVTVKPEGPHEVPEPLAVPKPHEVQVSHNPQDS